MEEKLDNLGIKLENKPLRDEKGRLLPNQESLNPLGRPKGKTLKEHQAEKFRTMTPEQKDKWIEEHKIDGETQWKMAEGNPTNLLDGSLDLKVGKLEELQAGLKDILNGSNKEDSKELL